MSIFSRRGLLIAIEGGDATGKHTQADRLRLRLEGEDGVRARSIAFPQYETPVGERVKALLAKDHDPLVLQALMTVDRYATMEYIEKTRGAGMHVVCDRYVPSGLVYGQAAGLPSKWLEVIHYSMLPADIYFLLDVDAGTAEARRPIPRDRYEADKGLRARVRQLYLDLWRERAKIEPGRWFVEDASRSIEQVHNAIWATVKSRL